MAKDVAADLTKLGGKIARQVDGVGYVRAQVPTSAVLRAAKLPGVSLANPAPGVYTIEVDGYSVPAGTTSFDYRDVFYSASLGAVSVPATSVTLGNGASATMAGSVTAQVAPAAGRQLFGELVVVTDEGAAVGRGNVSIGTVN